MSRITVPEASPPPRNVVQLERRFAEYQKTYKRIEQPTYELCGLTEDEIRIVEEATQ